MLTISLSQWGTLEKLWGVGGSIPRPPETLTVSQTKIFSHSSYFRPVSILQADPRQTRKPAISEQLVSKSIPFRARRTYNITYIM